MTKAQEKRFYREAVRRTLISIYKTPADEAEQLVESWWVKIKDTAAVTTRLYLHDEAINTAADLLRRERAVPISRVRETYEQILTESRKVAAQYLPQHAKPKLSRLTRLTGQTEVDVRKRSLARKARRSA